jgi:transketolase
VTKRFEASGWEVTVVEDGNDLRAIEETIKAARESAGKPKLIRIKTIIGYGMPKQGTNKAHSDAPGVDAVKETKRNLEWPENKSFFYSEGGPGSLPAGRKERCAAGKGVGGWCEKLRQRIPGNGYDLARYAQRKIAC